jgi:hypothetical protein
MKMTAMEIFTGTEDATIERREGRKALIRAALIIFVVAIAATIPGWLPGKVYGGIDPRSATARMAVEYAAQRLKAGEVPLWNPHVGLGAPVLGDGRTGVFFPTIVLHMLMPAKWAWVASAVVLMWVGGFGVVLLLMKARTGSQRESYLGPLVAGVMYMLFAMCIRFLDPSAMNGLALLPWALVACRGLTNRVSAMRLVGVTLLFLMIFVGGDDAVAVGIVLTCVIDLAWNFARRPKQWEGFAGALLALAGALVVAGTVAAVQWMSEMERERAEGVDTFGIAAPNVLSPFVLAPVVALGLAMFYGWVIGQSRGFSGKLLLWLGPAGPLGFVILFNSAPVLRQDLANALKWVQGQNQGATVRVLAEGNDSWEVPGNALATVSGPKRTKEWLAWAEQIQRYEIFLARVDHPALRLLGTKYLITDRRWEQTTRPAMVTATAPARRLFGGGAATAPMGKMEWKPVWPTTRPTDSVVVYENVAQPLPRFWIARNARWSDKAQEIFDWLRNSDEQADFDPRDVVLLDREGEAESEFGMLRRPPLARGIGRLELLEDSPERVRIETQGAGGWLVLADAYAPGWKAKMSYTAVSRGPRRNARERTYERELAIVPAYGALRAVALAGGAEIIFEYEPKGWKNGLMVGGIGAIVLLLMVGGMMFPSGKESGSS